jgi:23S rRNA maturation-related 3'-5' exoribonuclease YhaM
MKTRQDRLKEFWNSPVTVALPSDFCKWLECSEFFYAPASTKYHGNYEGGLFDHSFMVMNTLVDLTRHNNLKWQRDGSPFIVGLLHDLCKIDQYKLGEAGYEYNTDTLLTGHGDK